MVFRLFSVVALWMLAGALGCGVEPRSAREVMAEGLSRALPDEELGPRTLPDLDGSQTDPLHRNPLLCARGMGALAYSATTLYERRDRSDGLRTRLEESVNLKRAASGDFTLSLARSLDGSEKSIREVNAIFVDNRFHTADATGVFFLRNPMRAQHLDWFRDAGEPLKVLVGLVQPSLRRESRGTKRWEGREVNVLALATVPRMLTTPDPSIARLRESTGTWDEWWRSAHGVEAIRGEILADPVTGCAVAGNLEIDLRFLEPAERGDALRIHHEFSLDVLATDPRIEAPSGARLPRRDRVVQMLREVLPKPTP